MLKYLPVPALLLATSALAQEHDHSAMDHSQMDHSQMDHSQMDHSQMDHSAMSPAEDENICLPVATLPPFATGSGTSRLPGFEGGLGGCGAPASDHPMTGLHVMAGDWMLMAHGYITAQYTDVSGPRGDDKLYSTSMAMLMAEHSPAWGRIQLKSMMSLEPAMDARGYPNLFATGETAGGEPLVDRQHPHDLFMELAGRVDVNVADGTSVFLYGGPVGEPAIGPSAFMHRASAANNPEPPIAHHWFDSTHITYGVVTAGVSSRRWQLEASAFRGREPDEERWNIETPKLDSWSVRATLTPSPSWAFQASYGEITEPEALHAGQDERRYTASAHYSRGALSAMAAFSAKDRVPGDTLTAWLGEVNWNLDEHNSLFGRIENVANDELFPDHDDPLHDQAFRVTKVQAGYARHIPLTELFTLTLGGSGAMFAKPEALDAAYGGNPFGYTLFARLSLGH
jgi:hypothetical protein